MFRRAARYLTERSNHTVDWSRAGSLFAANHRYNRREISVTTSIVAVAAAAGFLSSYLNNKNKTHLSNTAIGITSFVLSFAFLHQITVVNPLRQKRLQMEKDCDGLVREIENKLKSFENDSEKYLQLKATINSLTKHILSTSLSTDQSARASQTWGHRKDLLTRISENITKDLDSTAEIFQGNDPADIIATLPDVTIQEIASTPRMSK